MGRQGPSPRRRRVPFAADPRRWMPAESTTIHVSATPPPEDYEIFLHPPDAAPALRARPEYAVRFANPDVWEPATGMNRLGATSSPAFRSPIPRGAR